MHGRCLCGSLVYEAEGQPSTVTVCHCRFCQRATGGAYLVDALFRRSRFRILDGTPSVYDHVSEGSGNVVHIQFCATCGTKLWLEFERWPDLIGVYAGTLDDPGGFDRSPDRTHYIFADQAADWTVMPAGARVYPGDLTDASGERVTPLCLSEPRVVGHST